jgi:hypothetical protein
MPYGQDRYRQNPKLVKVPAVFAVWTKMPSLSAPPSAGSVVALGSPATLIKPIAIGGVGELALLVPMVATGAQRRHPSRNRPRIPR